MEERVCLLKLGGQGCKPRACLTWPLLTSYLVVYMPTFQSTLLMILDRCFKNVIPITLFLCLKYSSNLPQSKQGLHGSGWSGSFVSLHLSQPCGTSLSHLSTAVRCSPHPWSSYCDALMEHSHPNPYTSFGFQVQPQCLREVFLDSPEQIGSLSNLFPQQPIHLFAYCNFLT